MIRFCQYCGSELKEEQDICLGCGRLIKRNNYNVNTRKDKKEHRGYVVTSSIIMIVLGACLVLAMSSDTIYDYPFLVFGLPGLFGIISGVLGLSSKNNKMLLLLAGIFCLLATITNIIGIIDISIYSILGAIFGILDMVYSRSK